MSWAEILALSAPTGMLAIAVWRFARLESRVNHQGRCQVMLIKTVSRLSVRQKSMARELRVHFAKGGKDG